MKTYHLTNPRLNLGLYAAYLRASIELTEKQREFIILKQKEKVQAHAING